MLHTKEFQEIMEFFERTAPKQIYIGGAIVREPSEHWKSGNYYSNGNANNFFKMFLSGYQMGKAVHIPVISELEGKILGLESGKNH